MTMSHDELYQYWEKRSPQQVQAGRDDARGDIESGMLKLKVAVDALIAGSQLVEVLAGKGIESDLFGDVGGPHPAYVVGYNQEMECEVDRRHGQGTMRAIFEQERRQKAE